MVDDPDLCRRQILRFGGVAVAGGLAGCSGSGNGTTGGPSPATEAGTTTTTTTDSAATATESTTTESTTTESTTPSGPLAEATKLVLDDGDRNDFFGSSVALSGDTALVGAPGDDPSETDSGAAYVFERSGGRWVRTATLAAADGEAEDYFGEIVALAGDTGIVAALGDDANGESAGAAYVFERADGRWTQRAKLTPDDGDAGDNFGSSIALASDTVVVGAYRDENPNGETAGSAYVFERSGDEWTQRAKLVADDGDEGDAFGYTVSLAGDTALVGARGDEDPNGGLAGSAYIFERSGGEWTQRAKLVADDGDPGDDFGDGVALTAGGDTALVGSVHEEDPNGRHSGATYVFERSGNNWTQRTKLLPTDGESEDIFGAPIATAGDVALVGVQTDDDPNGQWAGSAYVFERAGGRWTQARKLAPDDGDAMDTFGSSVALSGSGNAALVGASADEDPNGKNSGAVYVFER